MLGWVAFCGVWEPTGKHGHHRRQVQPNMHRGRHHACEFGRPPMERQLYSAIPQFHTGLAALGGFCPAEADGGLDSASGY